jgi:hypothetical protein
VATKAPAGLIKFNIIPPTTTRTAAVDLKVGDPADLTILILSKFEIQEGGGFDKMMCSGRFDKRRDLVAEH